jgi:hypothetical protein
MLCKPTTTFETSAYKAQYMMKGKMWDMTIYLSHNISSYPPSSLGTWYCVRQAPARFRTCMADRNEVSTVRPVVKDRLSRWTGFWQDLWVRWGIFHRSRYDNLYRLSLCAPNGFWISNKEGERKGWMWKSTDVCPLCGSRRPCIQGPSLVSGAKGGGNVLLSENFSNTLQKKADLVDLGDQEQASLTSEIY